MSTKETLIKKLREKDVRIGILGLGYVGLPLAVVFGEAGFKVMGFDPDSRKVDALKRAVSYIPDVKTGTVEKLVSTGHLTATTDSSFLQEMDAVSICGPASRWLGRSRGEWLLVELSLRRLQTVFGAVKEAAQGVGLGVAWGQIQGTVQRLASGADASEAELEFGQSCPSEPEVGSGLSGLAGGLAGGFGVRARSSSARGGG